MQGHDAKVLQRSGDGGFLVFIRGFIARSGIFCSMLLLPIGSLIGLMLKWLRHGNSGSTTRTSPTKWKRKSLEHEMQIAEVAALAEWIEDDTDTVLRPPSVVGDMGGPIFQSKETCGKQQHKVALSNWRSTAHSIIDNVLSWHC